MSWYEWRGDDLILNLKIQPKASRDKWAGPLGGRYKVTITAPPVDGQANSHLIKFIAKSFGVAKSRVEILSGESGREKRILIHDPTKLIEGIEPHP